MFIDEDSRDAITELINIGVGRAAGLLNEITGSTIQLRVPEIRVYRLRDLTDSSFTGPKEELFSIVIQEFRGKFSGVTGLGFRKGDALSLVRLLSGESGTSTELDADQTETLKEVGNIVINAVMGSIANILSEPLSFSLPVYYEGGLSSAAAGRIPHDGDNLAIVARTRFIIESMQIEGIILLVLEVGSLEQLIESIRALEPRPEEGEGP